MKGREELVEIASELMEKLNEKRISPNEAKSVARILEAAVDKSNEENMKNFMETATFHGSSPES